MAFLETPRFPEDVSHGMKAGPTFKTDKVVVSSGRETREPLWENARAKYDVSYGAVTQEQLDELIDFFRAVMGSAYSFRLKDWSDYKFTVTNGRLGTGVGTGYPTYQIRKRYIAGALSEIRDITKPVTGTLAVFKNAVQQTLTVNYSIDYTTGIVTFVATTTASVTGGITKANPGVVTSLAHPFTNGQIIYLSGIVGMTELNGTIATVANKTANTFQLLGINTTSYGTYVSGGTISLFPQPADVLTCSGEFDVPVRFESDEMQYQIISGGPDEFIISWDAVMLIEVKGE